MTNRNPRHRNQVGHPTHGDAATRKISAGAVKETHMHPSMREYDLVVIGSGPGGHKAAIAAAKLGKTVAAIEHDRMLGGASLSYLRMPVAQSM
jgi:NADPH-dependent 2,4-dienoyl-CoA reductase/sulfur reductase-like enzyme